MPLKSVGNTSAQAVSIRQPTEIPGYYDVQRYLLLELQNPSIQIHIYGTNKVSTWMLNNVSQMVENMIGGMNYSSHRVQFNDHHIFVITDDDPDVPYSSLPGHKNTGTIGFTILNQTIICAEAVDTLYPDLPPTWRAWDTPIHEFGHAIEHTLALETYSDSVFRSAEPNYNQSVAREYFSWFSETWFDANLSKNTNGKTLQEKRSALHQSIFGYYNWLFNFNDNWKPSCTGRPDPIQSIDLKQLVGQYERQSIENDWHKINISLQQNGTLKWRNDAGREWTIFQSNGELFTGNDCPYGIKPVQVIRKNNKLAGLKFLNDTFTRQLNPVQVEDILGQYKRLPVTNGWHSVSITQDDSGVIWWSNENGFSWPIYLNNEIENELTLVTDTDSPYGYQVITIEKNGLGMVTALKFNSELYTKQ
ncbi:MAG: hypothetical protein HWE27_07370 [Gammaproteobacteria bacterium]|nr:hypothetical protein [Gammaproteobacteria bacterium]